MMSKKVSQIAYILFCLWIWIPWLDTVQSAEMGPLHVQHRYPLYLMFLTPEPDSARLIEKGRFVTTLSTDYTSIYIDEASDQWSALIDMEMTVVDLSLAYGLTKRVNISLAIPWISMNDGFMDSSLDSYHAMFGFPNYGKENGPVDEFGYHNQYGISPLTLYLNTGILLLSDPETQAADVHVSDMMTLLAGIEYNISDTWSLMGQFNFVTSPFHNTGIAQMDQDSLELALGFAISMSDNTIFEFAFSEDLTRTAPDFTIHGALRYKFGL